MCQYALGMHVAREGCVHVWEQWRLLLVTFRVPYSVLIHYLGLNVASSPLPPLDEALLAIIPSLAYH